MVPGAMQQALIAYPYSKCKRLHLLTPNSLPVHTPPPRPQSLFRLKKLLGKSWAAAHVPPRLSQNPSLLSLPPPPALFVCCSPEPLVSETLWLSSMAPGSGWCCHCVLCGSLLLARLRKPSRSLLGVNEQRATSGQGRWRTGFFR